MSTRIRDITYCDAEECLSFVGCFRALTPALRQASGRSGFPVSMFYNPRELECYRPPEPGDQRPEEVIVS